MKFQLLALLAITSFNFADAKALEDSNDAALIEEKRGTEYQIYKDADEEKLQKRDPEMQFEEDMEYEDVEYEEMLKRDLEDREEIKEKRDLEAVDDTEEEVEKRDTEETDEETQVENDEAENEEVEEKRDEEEDSDSETSSEDEDVEKRAIQARFTLVDGVGNRIYGQRQGLLLFNGGTVCDDGFGMNSAHAICRTMGYSRATRYRNGLVYGSFQSRKRIGLDDVICSSTHWASCRSTTRHNCHHGEDILLTCQGLGFKLLNSRGYSTTGQTGGLLSWNGGTVCDDYFNINSANAICRVMGFASAIRFSHGLFYRTQQMHRGIALDNVRCRASWWNYCSYSTRNNCNHSEDVFLYCRQGGSH